MIPSAEARPALDRRRIWTFVAVAFGFTWIVDGVIWATGGLADGPRVTTGVSLALPLLIVSMFGPAVGVIVTRWVTKEGWEQHRVRLRRPVWPWVAAWLGPGALAVVGAGLYYLVFPDRFDSSMPVMQEQLALAAEQTGQAIPIPAVVLGLVQVAAAFTVAPIINAIPAFGEEFGWRGYLQWKLRPLGWRKAMLLTNVAWGVWHWPIIAMGYNYGLDHPGAPWSGMFMMVVFTLAAGTFLGWAAERTGSMLPAAIGHGAINAVAGIGVLFLASGADPDPLLGPAMVGAVGGAALILVGLVLFLRPPRAVEA